MNVPVFDEAYRERLRQRKLAQAQLEMMRRQLGSLGGYSTSTGPTPERTTLDELREDFAMGRITLETYERRVTAEVERETV